MLVKNWRGRWFYSDTSYMLYELVVQLDCPNVQIPLLSVLVGGMFHNYEVILLSNKCDVLLIQYGECC